MAYGSANVRDQGMHGDTADHAHQHTDDHYHSGERATTLVLVLTVVTMVVEVTTGWWTGSMALLADGWHMGMHAAAMGVAVVAYRFMRRHLVSERFASADKAGDLGGFANAVILAVVAILIGGESLTRLVTPGPIAYSAALIVAVVGLAVNLVSAWLLRAAPHQHANGQDHNREAAFVHVASDALTSALAIAALWFGRRYGITWLDPLTGLVGAVVIARWSLTLLRRTSGALLGERSVVAAGEGGHSHP